MVRVLTIIILLASVRVVAREIVVGPTGEHRTVRAGLAAAADGDVVTIRRGVYAERDLTIDRSITLRGERGAVIDGRRGKASILIVRADHVTITGLTIRNVGISYVDDHAAIKVKERKNIAVEWCTIENGFFAVYLERCENVRVRYNRCIARNGMESNSGNGVHAWTCRNVLVEGNTFRGHRDGIYFEFMKQGTVLRNHSEGNMRYGLHFMFSDSCSYRHNVFAKNGAGVAVMYTKYIEMLGNEFRDNWGSAAYGLLLKEITHSHLRDNRFFGNSVGIHGEGASNCLVERNVFRGNGYAIRLMGNCDDDRFTNNIFDGNSFDVTTNSTTATSIVDRNYWSEYEGYDLDRDGVGDVPHHPVRLYAMMVEQMPSSVILMHSLFVDILDLAERVVPSVTPQTLIDRHPLIRPPFSETSRRP
jgi:nitrous oxidase accessory protein